MKRIKKIIGLAMLPFAIVVMFAIGITLDVMGYVFKTIRRLPLL